ncbi:hypothetical protein OUZ56_003162 [Daphnia magna]|uniref:Uncharacterized protein n=1 Tax=Daphnia magna TaxID=35525 RepID=A0ABR0A7X0_9CRUS|nr:hypothetical protein OUZ56_003162 [Daphnia magna]
MYCYLVFPELVSKATVAIQAGTQASSRSSPAPSTSSRHVTEQTNYSSAEESSDEEEEDEEEEDEEEEDEDEEEEEDEDGFHARKDAFPIKKENLKNMSTRDERNTSVFTRTVAQSYTRGDLKIPIPREQYVKIQDAIFSMLKVKLKKHRLPPKLESAISQKFNQVRPTAAGKRETGVGWDRGYVGQYPFFLSVDVLHEGLMWTTEMVLYGTILTIPVGVA